MTKIMEELHGIEEPDYITGVFDREIFQTVWNLDNGQWEDFKPLEEEMNRKFMHF